MKRKYIIRWLSSATGKWGNGSTLFTREDIDAEIKRLDAAYPGIQHFRATP